MPQLYLKESKRGRPKKTYDMEILPPIEPSYGWRLRILQRRKLLNLLYWAVLVVVAVILSGVIYKTAWLGGFI